MSEENTSLDETRINASSLDSLLLPRDQFNDDDRLHLTQNDIEFKRSQHSMKARFKTLSFLFLPVALAQLMEVGLEFVNLNYAGRLGNYKYLAGMGFSITVTNVLCQSILTGLSYGFQTLGAQAFGARNYELYGRYCHQAFFIILSAGICLFPLFYFLGDLLAVVGIDQEVAALVGQYAIIVYPGFIFYAEGILIRRFFQSQRLLLPQILPGVFVLPLHIGLCQFFASYLNLGYRGIAIAICFTYTLKALFFLLFMLPVCRCIKQRDTVQPFSCQDFKNWSLYLRVALPALLLGLVEWWSFELSTIVCSFASVQILAAQAVIMNYAIMMYLVSVGASNALTTVVGNAIGMNEPKLAALYSRDGVLFSLGFALILVTLSVVFRDFILSLFTQQQQILQILHSVFYLALFGIVLDVIQNAQNGILRGLGQVVLPSVVALVVFYVFFQPISISLLLTTDLGLQSIWLILPFTALLNGLGYLYLIRRINWKQLAYRRHKELSVSQFKETEVQK